MHSGIGTTSPAPRHKTSPIDPTGHNQPTVQSDVPIRWTWPIGCLPVDVIFNFSRYEELRQSVLQLVRENLDPDLLQEEAQDLFESWWAADASSGQWNEEVKQRLWTTLWQEFGRHSDQR